METISVLHFFLNSFRGESRNNELQIPQLDRVSFVWSERQRWLSKLRSSQFTSHKESWHNWCALNDGSCWLLLHVHQCVWFIPMMRHYGRFSRLFLAQCNPGVMFFQPVPRLLIRLRHLGALRPFQENACGEKPLVSRPVLQLKWYRTQRWFEYFSTLMYACIRPAPEQQNGNFFIIWQLVEPPHRLHINALINGHFLRDERTNLLAALCRSEDSHWHCAPDIQAFIILLFWRGNRTRGNKKNQ